MKLYHPHIAIQRKVQLLGPPQSLLKRDIVARKLPYALVRLGGFPQRLAKETGEIRHYALRLWLHQTV